MRKKNLIKLNFLKGDGIKVYRKFFFPTSLRFVNLYRLPKNSQYCFSK